MALQHGNGTPMQQQQEMYTDEQKRDIERGMILLTIRRYLRFFVLICFVVALVINIIKSFSNDDSILIVFIACAVGAVAWYGILWLLTMAAGGFCIKIYLYFRDLFTSKNTRI